MPTLSKFDFEALEEMFNLGNDPVQPLPLLKVLHGLTKVQFGTAVVANTETTAVVAVGTEFNGKPVIATLNDANGAVHVLHASVADGDLTITLSAAATADRDVAWLLLGM